MRFFARSYEKFSRAALWGAADVAAAAAKSFSIPKWYKTLYKF